MNILKLMCYDQGVGMVLTGQDEKSRKNVLNLREQMESVPTIPGLRNVETLVAWIIFLTLYDIIFSNNGYKFCIIPNDSSQPG